MAPHPVYLWGDLVTLAELDAKLAELREKHPDNFRLLEADERTAAISRHPAGKALRAEDQ